MNLERHQEALTAFRKVVEASPKFTRALLCLASALGAYGHAEEAGQLVARSLAMNGNQWQPHAPALRGIRANVIRERRHHGTADGGFAQGGIAARVTRRSPTLRDSDAG